MKTSQYSWSLLIGAALLVLLHGCGGHRLPPSGPLPDNRAWLDNLTAPASLRQALAQGTLEFVVDDEHHVIPVRVFGREKKGIPILFTHGLQSHSGWFAQSAAYLADLGHPVYAMDRMGSGFSPAPRGDVKDFHEWVEEIDELATLVMARYDSDSFLLVGHCFGAIPATAYAASHPEQIHGLILTTPAIYTTTSIPVGDMLRIFFSSPENLDFYISSPLRPDSFSELPEYQRFIAADQLALTAATGSFYLQVYNARKYIEEHVQQLQMPLLMMLAGEDPICDNDKNRQFFNTVPAREKTLVEFMDARHILEFSTEQQLFFNALSRWLLNR